MRSLVGFAAVGCVVGAVAARGPYKWSQDKEAQNWHPARETPELGYMAVLGLGPEPTPPPKVDEGKLRRRSTSENTCAYVDGRSDQSLYCNTDSACVFNSAKSNIGCCPDSSISCPIWTTCYDSTDSSKYTTNNGFSLYCGSSVYPHCLKHVYADDFLSGYTLLGCGKTGGSDVVYYSVTGAAGPTTAKPKSSDSSTARVTVTTSPPPPTTTAAAAAAAPVGAIVGGVVGGVAALGLVGLGVFFIVRRGRRQTDAGAHSSLAAPPAHAQGPPPGPGMAMYGGGPPPQMTEPVHQAQYGFAPVDNRSSIAKAAPYYDGSVTSSPPTSPPPLHNPAPTYQPYPQHYAPGMGHQSGPVPSHYPAAELDTARGDRELRELE